MCSTENIKNIKSVLEARAIFDNEKRTLHLRVGSLTDQKENGAIYYDLANKDWTVVKITEHGWQIENSPILFRRYGTTGTQVMPSKEFTLITYPNLGHLFFPSSVWTTSLGPIQPYVLADLYAWLEAHSGHSHSFATTTASTMGANATSLNTNTTFPSSSSKT